MCNSKSILNSQKRDYLLLYKKQELTKIMKENGKYKQMLYTKCLLLHRFVYMFFYIWL